VIDLRRHSNAFTTALGLIRLTNGLVALFAPGFFVSRLGSDRRNGVARYAFRMFGIRTIFLGLDLLTRDPEQRAHALRRAPIIHGTDAAAALVAGITRQVPLRAAAMTFTVSGVNLALSLAARPAPGVEE